MSNIVYFYTISFETKDKKPTDRKILPFLKQIENLLKNNTDSTIRVINNSKYRLSSFFWSDNKDEFVIIPIGKRKNGAPYVVGEDKRELKELERDVYDVNLLGYDNNKNVMIMTKYLSAPTTIEIENYLNSYLLPNENARIRINPLYYNSTIEKVRESPRVKSIVLSLNLRATMIDLYKDHALEEESILSFFGGFASSAKNDIQGNKMKVEIAIGQGKKEETLDKESLFELLDTLNLDSSFIDEIEIKYVDKTSQRTDTAPLKNTELHIRHIFSLPGSKMAAEYLKHNFKTAIDDEFKKYSMPKKRYFERLIHIDNGYTFVDKWGGGAVVD